nr:MAG TPA: hypothetical protein [Caudoviricetes sp.]
MGLSGPVLRSRAIASATLWLPLCVALCGSCALYEALGLPHCVAQLAGAIPVRSLWAVGVRSALLILRASSACPVRPVVGP